MSNRSPSTSLEAVEAFRGAAPNCSPMWRADLGDGIVGVGEWSEQKSEEAFVRLGGSCQQRRGIGLVSGTGGISMGSGDPMLLQCGPPFVGVLGQFQCILPSNGYDNIKGKAIDAGATVEPDLRVFLRREISSKFFRLTAYPKLRATAATCHPLPPPATYHLPPRGPKQNISPLSDLRALPVPVKRDQTPKPKPKPRRQLNRRDSQGNEKRKKLVRIPSSTVANSLRGRIAGAARSGSTMATSTMVVAAGSCLGARVAAAAAPAPAPAVGLPGLRFAANSERERKRKPNILKLESQFVPAFNVSIRRRGQGLSTRGLRSAGVRSAASDPEQLRAAREDVKKLLAEKKCHPILIRLGWHDAGSYDKNIAEFPRRGGANGSLRFSPELGHGANAGLINAVKLLEPVKAKYAGITYADLFQLASATAIEELGGPKIPMRYGRVDTKSPEECAIEGNLPDAGPPNPADHLRKSWTAEWLKFDNSYFRDIKAQSDEDLLVLPTDKVLAEDPEFKKFTDKYAEDQNAFFADYALAHAKLSELGSKFDPEEGIFIDQEAPPKKEPVVEKFVAAKLIMQTGREWPFSSPAMVLSS
ncbi:hypothetical protein AXG93_4697s1380 [Marchantia polymorpha subsp. ruderalis]|uniref:Plant heme peroxidase family profile domain-containing protein n=1 Tax=Marchantia polymorpha subsp. ruderalis TaxID=1480154 RepID=A0A176VQC6_MARPO|nr:hypothetical protein AXG93_4697s1380 [Marchantia polymorpha subsp. ruderalis]